MKSEIVFVNHGPCNTVNIDKKEYEFSVDGYCRVDHDFSSWGGTSFHIWSKIESTIDLEDSVDNQKYVKVVIEYYKPPQRDGYAPHKSSFAFYSPKDAAYEIKKMYDAHNKILEDKKNLIQQYQNQSIESLANNFISMMGDYLLMPRMIQALYNKYSHCEDYSLKVFESETLRPKSKIDKQKNHFNASLR